VAKKPSRELLTRAAYAIRRDVAPRTIGKYVQRNIIPLHNNKIDPAEADQILSEYLALPLGSGRQPSPDMDPETFDSMIYDMGPDVPELKKTKSEKVTENTQKEQENIQKRSKTVQNTSYSDARTREKQLKVELLELDLALKRGQMVLTKDVEFAAYTQGRNIRDKMLNIPDRVCAILAAEPDETKLRNYLMKEIESELSSVKHEELDPERFTR
jgi:hypothetical protein